MTIRAKLYTATVVAVVALALTVGVGVWAMAALADRFDHVQRAADARALALELKFGVTDFNGWQTAYGYDNGRSRPIFLSSVDGFSKTLAQARQELTRPGEQALLDRVEAAFDDFMRLDVDAYAALRKGQAARVRRILLGPEIANFRRAASAAERLARAEDAHAAAQESAFRDARADALRFLIASSVIAAFLVVILLVTATDLARRAERALEAEAEAARSSGS